MWIAWPSTEVPPFGGDRSVLHVAQAIKVPVLASDLRQSARLRQRRTGEGEGRGAKFSVSRTQIDVLNDYPTATNWVDYSPRPLFGDAIGHTFQVPGRGYGWCFMDFTTCAELSPTRKEARADMARSFTARKGQ